MTRLHHGVVGLDLSLTRTGVCYIPPWWDGKNDSIVVSSIETQRDASAKGDPYALSDMETKRYLKIAKYIIGFVGEYGVSYVAREGYAFSTVRTKSGKSFQSSSVTKLAELGGVVQSQLFLFGGISLISIQPNSARKYLTGGLKRGNQKDQVRDFLRPFGFVFRNNDEMDSFVIACAMYGQVNNVNSCFLKQKEFGFLEGE